MNNNAKFGYEIKRVYKHYKEERYVYVEDIIESYFSPECTVQYIEEGRHKEEPLQEFFKVIDRFTRVKQWELIPYCSSYVSGFCAYCDKVNKSNKEQRDEICKHCQEYRGCEDCFLLGTAVCINQEEKVKQNIN